ncbi:Sua5/YciO/YrdC/YwlC family protein [Salipiger profundus]|uniref:Sua5/YciO/YrdC/YwlC family protein n=1 Tax=Salipiger profundus TaxID=1229727 RepID=UPI0008E91E6E|nr:Sua5/YciO/YrdC/YwlC family protein [Salipiger profundus]SFD80901.1 tRNA A37 threonylcarbamoyladenosine synthetase subunit TsaC/SUA5/YrdC [Salipiger profundus]
MSRDTELTQMPLILGRDPGRPDIEAHIATVWETMKSGGIAIVANDVGYGIWAADPAAVEMVYRTKRRGPHKRHAVTVDIIGQREIHVLDRRRQDMIECVTQDYDLPLGVVARFRPDHPFIRAIPQTLFKASTASGTVGCLMNGGRIHRAIGKLARENLMPVFGSSANISGSGTKFRIEDIEPGILGIADVIVDYGLRPYHPYQRSSTIMDFETLEVLRMGSCYELISDVLRRHFDLDLPVDPGRSVNPSGHLHEFALEDFDQS